MTGLTASPSLNASDAGSWSPNTRAHVSWTPGKYDSLSGVGYYHVLIDGSASIPNAAADQGRVYEIPGVSPSSITVEDMPPGKHKISIVAVDRATNEGPAASTYFYSDPDFPGLVIQNPAAASTKLNAKSALSAEATDSAGISSVKFAIDGITVGTVRPASLTTDYTAKFTPKWSQFTNGTHTLEVTDYDMVGRATTRSRTFKLDTHAPSLTVVSHSGSPFYPRLRDGFKDNWSIKFKTGEAGSASLLVYSPSGALARTITKTIAKAGTYSMSWDGTSSKYDWMTKPAQNTDTPKFRVKIRVRDAAGNTHTSSSYAATMKFYEIVKTGPSTVKVVLR